MLGRGLVTCAVSNRAADDGRLLVAAEVARDDLAAAATAIALDQRSDVVRGQPGPVEFDGHRLGDRVRLGVNDPGLPPQPTLEGARAARAQ